MVLGRPAGPRNSFRDASPRRGSPPLLVGRGSSPSRERKHRRSASSRARSRDLVGLPTTVLADRRQPKGGAVVAGAFSTRPRRPPAGCRGRSRLVHGIFPIYDDVRTVPSFSLTSRSTDTCPDPCVVARKRALHGQAVVEEPRPRPWRRPRTYRPRTRCSRRSRGTRPGRARAGRRAGRRALHLPSCPRASSRRASSRPLLVRRGLERRAETALLHEAAAWRRPRAAAGPSPGSLSPKYWPPGLLHQVVERRLGLSYWSTSK